MQFLINFIELTYHYYILFYIIVYLIFILNLYFNNESSVNQKILNSIRVSWVKEDIFRSFIRLSIIISLFIPFHVINVVISETLTFFIFGWYITKCGKYGFLFRSPSSYYRAFPGWFFYRKD